MHLFSSRGLRVSTQSIYLRIVHEVTLLGLSQVQGKIVFGVGVSRQRIISAASARGSLQECNIPHHAARSAHHLEQYTTSSTTAEFV